MKELTTQSVTKIQWTCDYNIHHEKASLGKFLHSPAFSTPCSTPSKKLTNVEWRLRLYPGDGGDERLDDYVAVGLDNLTNIKATAKFEVALQNYSGVQLCKSGERLGQPGKQETWVVQKLTRLSSVRTFFMNLEVAGYLFYSQEGKLTVVCTISDVSAAEEGEVNGRLELQDDRVSELTAHYEGLLETGKFSDVTFTIGEKSMRLHKNILTSTSEVFRAMFDHEMREQKESVVDVVDVDFDVMKEMMRYVYARRVIGIEKIAAELFVVADRYAVEDLKQLCENKLIDDLNVDKALSHFELSVKYGMMNLKQKVLDFVVRNMKELVGKSEFKELSSNCKDELLSFIATKTLIVNEF